MNRNRFFLLMLVVALFGFQSCDDKEDDKPESKLKQGEISVDATAFDKWTYVSLETGKEVGKEDVTSKKAGTDWDIAFHRYDVRLNCGKSGEGKAGAYFAPDKIGKSGWDAIAEAPETGYAVDEMIKVIKEYKMPPEYAQVGGSPVITGGQAGTWVKMEGMPPTYKPTNQIFIIKTAKGKYGKLWIKQYSDASKKGGHITFKYAIQENGSKDLK